MKYKICNACGTSMGLSEDRCPSCKLFLNFRVVNDVESDSIHKTEGKFCSYCNIKLDQDSMFCKLCGRAIRKSRYISPQTKREVWRRDMGRCVECGSKELLEYDHVIPFSRGGSNTVRNIQLLCERCNRSKNNNI